MMCLIDDMYSIQLNKNVQLVQDIVRWVKVTSRLRTHNWGRSKMKGSVYGAKILPWVEDCRLSGLKCMCVS